MLKDIKLPEALLEFIESAKQQLLAVPGTESVDRVVELVWTDMLGPSYTNIILYISGSGTEEWMDRCIEIKFELNDAKPEAVFACAPAPFLRIECCLI